MNFGRSLISPSYNRAPVFDNVMSTDIAFEFTCVSCGNSVCVNYDLLIKTSWSWEDDFSDVELRELKKFYEIGVVNKSKDGGRPSVLQIPCRNCATLYSVYAGVNEYANSAFKITMQGITELLSESLQH